jgi:hypothetical protein
VSRLRRFSCLANVTQGLRPGLTSAVPPALCARLLCVRKSQSVMVSSTYFRKKLGKRQRSSGIERPRNDRIGAVSKIAAELLKMASEIEAVADDGFGDQVVGRACDAHAYAEVDLPLWREIQVDRGKDLVFLFWDWHEARHRPD